MRLLKDGVFGGMRRCRAGWFRNIFMDRPFALFTGGIFESFLCLANGSYSFLESTIVSAKMVRRNRGVSGEGRTCTPFSIRGSSPGH